jgi:hypothetical protein
MAPAVGLEPTTNRLTADRSTTELRWIIRRRYTLRSQPAAASRSLKDVGYGAGFEPTVRQLPDYDADVELSFRILEHVNAVKIHRVWLRGRDLNPRPSGYEPDELPDCSTPRLESRICQKSEVAATRINLRCASSCSFLRMVGPRRD